MNVISIFKLSQIILLVIFVIYISDFRRKRGMYPLINEKLTKLLKISYLFPLILYVYIVINLESIFLLDILALILTALGTLTVVKAKKDLSKKHTWVGYSLSDSTFTTKGIYSYIRHPIYTGIYLFIGGGLFTTVPHAISKIHPVFSLIALLSIIYILFFITFLANKETKTLNKLHGKKFQTYKENVHPFLPIQRFQKFSDA